MAAALACLLLLAADGDEGAHGAYGWGLGIEVPLSVLGGLGDVSNPGIGYSFGIALDYELTRALSTRLFVDYSETFAGSAPVQYELPTGFEREEYDAELFLFTVGLGATWAFETPLNWSPYVGFDAGLVFGGYDYNFGQDPEDLRAGDVGDVFRRCTGSECQSDLNDNAQLTWSAGARGGAQFELTSWLRSAFELSVSYVPFATEEISNTVAIRNVSGVAEGLFLARLTYIARIGL